MRTALICTTINTPTVLELYRRHGPDVAFFVAGDKKTPTAAYDFATAKVGNWHKDNPPICRFFDVEEQEGLGYKCSDLIGWNTIQRRNIALLEAVKWGAEIIVSVDDDNLPIQRHQGWGYFDHFKWQLGNAFDGVKVSSPTGWFDVGQLLDPVAPHRGFPISVDGSKYEVSHVTNARVGVAAGICLGNPDISAVTRIASAPIVHRVSELLNSGIVVDPSTKTVFNSQNTAFIRELAPAFFMLPGVGRYDDIYASLIMQRVMRERNLHVHFGKPFVWQQRNQHNLVKDLRGEIDGMEKIEQFARYLDRISLTRYIQDDGSACVQQLRTIWRGFNNEPNSYDLVPPQTVEAALAFLDDMEGVL